MKPAIKKLRTCTYSKDLVSSPAIFGQREQHTNKLVCDHPEMKVNWNEKVCGPCTVYENRNAVIVESRTLDRRERGVVVIYQVNYPVDL